MGTKRLGIWEATGLILSLAGIGIQILWPNQKWLGWAFIVAGVALAFGVTIWALAIRHANKQFAFGGRERPFPPTHQTLTQHAPINNNPTFLFAPTVNAEQSQTQTQSQRVLDSTEPVSVEPGAAQIEKSRLDVRTSELANLYQSSYDDPQETYFRDGRAVTAKFRRDDDSPIPTVLTKATIHFFDVGFECLFTVDEGFWWQPEGGHKTGVGLGVGQTEKLIIAILGSEGEVLPYAGHYVTTERVGLHKMKEFVLHAPALPKLYYLVRVDLVGVSQGKCKLRKSYYYDLLADKNVGEFKLQDHA